MSYYLSDNDDAMSFPCDTTSFHSLFGHSSAINDEEKVENDLCVSGAAAANGIGDHEIYHTPPPPSAKPSLIFHHQRSPTKVDFIHQQHSFSSTISSDTVRTLGFVESSVISNQDVVGVASAEAAARGGYVDCGDEDFFFQIGKIRESSPDVHGRYSSTEEKELDSTDLEMIGLFIGACDGEKVQSEDEIDNSLSLSQWPGRSMSLDFNRYSKITEEKQAKEVRHSTTVESITSLLSATEVGCEKVKASATDAEGTTIISIPIPSPVQVIDRQNDKNIPAFKGDLADIRVRRFDSTLPEDAKSCKNLIPAVKMTIPHNSPKKGQKESFRLLIESGDEADADSDAEESDDEDYGVVGSGADLYAFVKDRDTGEDVYCVVQKSSILEYETGSRKKNNTVNLIRETFQSYKPPSGKRKVRPTVRFAEEFDNGQKKETTPTKKAKKTNVHVYPNVKKVVTIRSDPVVDVGNDSDSDSEFLEVSIFDSRFGKKSSTATTSTTATAAETHKRKSDQLGENKNKKTTSHKREKRSSNPGSVPRRTPSLRVVNKIPDECLHSTEGLVEISSIERAEGAYINVDATPEMADLFKNGIAEYTEFSEDVHKPGLTEDDYAIPFSIEADGRHSNPSTSHASSMIKLVRVLKEVAMPHAINMITNRPPPSAVTAHSMRFGRAVTRGSETVCQVDSVMNIETYGKDEIAIGVLFNAHSMEFEAMIGDEAIKVRPNSVLVYDKRVKNFMKKTVCDKRQKQRSVAKRFETSIVFSTNENAVASGGGARNLTKQTLDYVLSRQSVPYADWLTYKQKWCRKKLAPPSSPWIRHSQDNEGNRYKVSWFPEVQGDILMYQVRDHWIETALNQVYIKKNEKSPGNYITNEDFPKEGMMIPLRHESVDAQCAQPLCSHEDRKLFEWQPLNN